MVGDSAANLLATGLPALLGPVFRDARDAEPASRRPLMGRRLHIAGGSEVGNLVRVALDIEGTRVDAALAGELDLDTSKGCRGVPNREAGRASKAERLEPR